MPDGCTPLSLYHLTEQASIASILATGIRPSESACGKDEPFPPKKKAVFAYDRHTLGMVARIIQRVGLQLDTLDAPVVEFEICAETAFIGELRQECRPNYPATVKPATHLSVFGGPLGYQEAEVFIPGGTIPATAIKKVHRLRDFLETGLDKDL